MVAGMERYFQIARCYRDEDFRADRQPEFTQLDIEMSFVEQDDVLAIAEEILVALWSLIGYEVPTPLPRMTYAEAMARFGSDKPDLRMGQELVECTDYFKDTTFRVFQADYVGAVVMPGGASQPRKKLDAWQEWAKQRGAKGLAYVLVGEDGELGGPVAKNLSDSEKAGLAAHVGAEPGDCIFFAAGPVKSSRALLGAARLEIGRRGEPDRRERLELPVGRGRARCSSPPATPPRRATSPSAAAPGRPCTTPSPRPRTSRPSTPTRATPWPGPTTSSATATRSAAARSGSTARTSRSASSPMMGLDEAEARGEVRLPARGVQVRRAAARRHRLRLGPDRRAARRHRLDPRRHRLPEVGRRLRPADGGAGTDLGRTAQGSRCGRRRRRRMSRPRAELVPRSAVASRTVVSGSLRVGDRL